MLALENRTKIGYRQAVGVEVLCFAMGSGDALNCADYHCRSQAAFTGGDILISLRSPPLHLEAQSNVQHLNDLLHAPL